MKKLFGNITADPKTTFYGVAFLISAGALFYAKIDSAAYVSIVLGIAGLFANTKKNSNE